jgi:hypothetical protein
VSRSWLQLLLNGAVSVDLEAHLDLFIRKNSPTQDKHLFAHYIGALALVCFFQTETSCASGQLGLLPEYALRTKQKEAARTKSLFGLKAAARRSVFR